MIGTTNSIWEINKSNYEQLVNYTMLYDGSLGESGESGANVCSNVTGGFYTNFNISSGFTSHTVNFTENSMQINQSTSGARYSNFATKLPVDVTNYNKVCVLAKYNFTGSTVTAQAYTSLNMNSAEQSTASATAKSVILYKGGNTALGAVGIQNNVKAFYSGDVSTLSENLYFAGMVGKEQSNTILLDIYEVFLVKTDDIVTLASKAGITATSIEQVLTNSATLLNNEDAVEFMIKKCTGDFMAQAIQSETFLTELNNSVYKTKIQANEHWSKFLNMVA